MQNKLFKKAQNILKKGCDNMYADCNDDAHCIANNYKYCIYSEVSNHFQDRQCNIMYFCLSDPETSNKPEIIWEYNGTKEAVVNFDQIIL